MSRVKFLVAHLFFALLALGPAEAQSLRVSPVTIDLQPGAASSVLNLDTENKDGVSVQVRVFRWSQSDGEDKLDKTSDVVVSPPAVTVHAGVSSTVRVVRVAKTPVSGEETYRIFVDEIPDRKKLQAGAVALVVRQNIPVFFAGTDAQPGTLAWKTAERKGKLFVEAVNTGQKRVRLTKVAVTGDSGGEFLKFEGLAYVLGGQSRAWELSLPPSRPGAAKTLTIKAESDKGPVNASAFVGKGG